MNKKDYLQSLKYPDHYDIEIMDIPITQGWNSNSPNFQLVKGRKTLVEIGSWTGGSAKTIASHMDEDAVLFCVDTFLGSHEHLNDRLIPLDSKHRPLLFDMFLKNTLNYKDKIIPFQTTSNTFAEYCRIKNMKFDFVYIDGDHTTVSVYNDLKNYYNLLNDNGIILGDDLTWGTVKKGLDMFCLENNCNYITSEEQFIIKKQ